MLDQVLDVFDLHPDVDLNLMQANQTLSDLTARAVAGCADYLAATKPSMVVVQGDTTTVFCAALAAFYQGVPIAHVEAGLRTWDRKSPFPEEANRKLTTDLADLHFAPTPQARDNLLREHVAPEDVVLTGNTVIDALLFAVEHVRREPPVASGILGRFLHADLETPLVLITGHRRENFGAGFEHICYAVRHLAELFPNTHFIYPVHLNPQVREPVYRILTAGGAEESRQTKPNIHLVEPLSYLSFVALMDRAKLILTDSGGVQEEAPSLGKPVLVMRDSTERPEGVLAGTARLVGTDFIEITNAVSALLTDAQQYASMASATNPYGDGRAASRIVKAIESRLSQ